MWLEVIEQSYAVDLTHKIIPALVCGLKDRDQGRFFSIASKVIAN